MDVTAKYIAAPPTLTDQQQQQLRVDATGALITTGGGASGTSTTQISSAGQAPYGMVAKVDAFGNLLTSGSTTPLFNDAFNAALDTTNMWTLSGTTIPVATGGAMVASLTAANSVSSVAISQPTFSPTTQPFLLAGQMNVGAQQTNPNAHRFFGLGVVTSYAAATPLTDGLGFEVDVTGALNAVVYISGTRYVVNSTNPSLVTAPGSFATGMTLATYGTNLTWPTTGIAIVSVRYFNGYAYFYMAGSATGFDVPIGVASWIPATTVYPLRFAAITTPAVSTVLATTFTLSSFIFGIQGGSNYTASDPTYPWRQQAVDANGRASVIEPEITAAGNITTQNLVPNGVATAGSAVAINTNGMPTVAIQIVGTYTGTLSVQTTVDNVNWVTNSNSFLLNVASNTYASAISSGTQSIYQANISGALAVRVTGLAAMTGTATITLRATPGFGALSGIGTLSTLAGGQAAHSSASTGAPVRVGGRVNTAADTTLVAGDASDLFVTTSGALVDKPYSVPELDWQASSGLTALATTTSTALKSAGAAGIRNYCTAIQLYNSSATVATTVTILDGAVVLWTGFLPATSAALQLLGVEVVFPTPLRGTAATALNIQLGTTAANVYYNAQGYQAA